MKVTQLLYSGAGGTSTYFQDLIVGDTDNLWSNSAIFYGIEALNEQLKDFCEKNDILYDYHLKKKGLTFSDYAKIYQSLKKYSPDVIINHTLIVSPAAWFYAKIHNIPLISVEHTNYRAKTLVDRISSYISFILSSKTVFFYEKQASFLGGIFRLLKNNIVLISKGIDLTFFDKKESKNDKRNPNKIALGMHCRIIKIKDLDTLVAAISQLRSKTYFKNLTLKIVGTGDFSEELQQLILKNGLSDTIALSGYMNRQNIPEFLHNLDVYVHTTFGETICYSIMEAQACSLPIVSADVEGVNTVIEHGKDGLLYEPRDADGLASLINQMIESEEARIRFGQRSRYLAETKFSNTIMFESFNGLIANLNSK